jgi:hypothetical protein
MAEMLFQRPEAPSDGSISGTTVGEAFASVNE